MDCSMQRKGVNQKRLMPFVKPLNSEKVRFFITLIEERLLCYVVVIHGF